MAVTLKEIASTPIGDIARRPTVLVTPDATLGTVVAQLCERGRGSVIVENGGHVVGILSERDIMLRVDHESPAWAAIPVRAVMTKTPRTVLDTQRIEEVLNLMLAGDYRHVPIVDRDGHLQGMVSIRDILVHIVGFFPQDFLNLPPDPDREAHGPWGG